jgi:hypothetical protein
MLLLVLLLLLRIQLRRSARWRLSGLQGARGLHPLHHGVLLHE